MSYRRRLSCLCLALVLGACAVEPVSRPAPIENKSLGKRPQPGAGAARSARGPVNRDPDQRPKSHTVSPGETLYSLALEYGLDYRELAQWNALADVNLIRVGQTLRLTPPDTPVQVRADAASPVASGVEVKPLSKPQPQAQPLESVVSQPKAVKRPYSETALAELNAALSAPPVAVTPVAATPLPPPTPAQTQPKPEASAANAGSAKPGNNTGGKLENQVEENDELLDWIWPTRGKLLARYNEKGNKGIDIGGKKGQEIFSASVGKVVYSGVGLRGYGKLVIIKHNKTYLSAYAHCQTIFVKEGDSVAKGQKIAEMGDSDSDVVKLHFEIRRFGKPVDPSKYLPAESAL